MHRTFRRLSALLSKKNMCSVELEVSSVDSLTKKEINKDEFFEVDPSPSTSVVEGKAEVQFPSSQDVFYNPVQEFNRDLSIAVLRLYASVYSKYYSKIQAGSKKCKNIPTIGDVIKNEKYLEHSFQENKENATVKDSKTTDNDDSCLSLLPPGDKYEDGINILEGLSASGLRSIRYAHEVGGVKQILANDFSEKAVSCIKHNIDHNKVGHLVSPSHNDASMVMYENRCDKKFHAIDLDPYGSPHQFLDAAVQSVTEGGILLVTCTDMAVLCGNTPETCYIKYGALSLKSKACHEIALRIVLQSIESHANRYSRYIVPLLSISADFYVRIVVQVFTSQKKCKETFSKLAHIYQCVGCETMTLQPLGSVLVKGTSVKYQLASGPQVPQKCDHCGHRHVCAGPVWAAPIHDENFVSLLKHSLTENDFNTYRRLFGILTMIEEELKDVPLYYIIDKLASTVSASMLRMRDFRSAILNSGYRVSMSHASKNSIKTDAPAEFIWDIMRACDKINPANRSKMLPNGAGNLILQKEQKNKISFDIHSEADPESKKKVLLRFQQNPEKNWGPKQKSKTSLFRNEQQEKRERKQGKKKRKLDEDYETKT